MGLRMAHWSVNPALVLLLCGASLIGKHGAPRVLASPANCFDSLFNVECRCSPSETAWHNIFLFGTSPGLAPRVLFLFDSHLLRGAWHTGWSCQPRSITALVFYVSFLPISPRYSSTHILQTHCK